MLVRKGNVEISVGKAVGHIIEDILISSNKRLWIVSPWLSPKYAEFLIKKKESGVDVKLITTNDLDNAAHKDSLKILIERKNEPFIENQKLAILISLIILVIGILTISKYFGVLLIFIGLCLISISLLKKEKFEAKIPVTIIDKSSDFTHSKIYIIDNNVGIVGSANLTDSGFWKNIETAVVMKDKKLVEELERTYKLLEEHPLKKMISIEEMGKKIYQSPIYKL